MKLGLAIAICIYVLGTILLSVYKIIKKKINDKKEFENLWSEK